MSELTDKITISESNFSPATKKDYDFRLGQFYRFSPIKSDDELIDCPTDELQQILVSYTRHLIKRVNSGDLSANTVPKMFRGIRWLLNSNYRENDVKWKPLEALFPKEVKRSGFKAWTTQQITLMIENTNQLRNKALIHFQASTGARVGVHDHPLLMKHLSMMEWNGHGCYAVLLYADSDETTEEKDLRERQDDVQSGDSYWAFLTPEATDALDRYFLQRKRNGEFFESDTPIFLKDKQKRQYVSTQLSDLNVTSILFRIIQNIPELKRSKKGRRHDIQINHGFRKRMNTILKLESKINSNIAEKIMGHKNGLDGVYLAPTRQECFEEFCKGILNLSISDTQRQKIQIKKLEDDKSIINELKAELKEKTLESTRKINDDHDVLVGLVNQMQEKSNRQTELIEMIHSLRKEVHELKQNPSR
ncbi:MAG: integrase [Nitrosopumilus sp.]|nr:integrase [Nitrosopumilus sp.]